jgi:hypothetical protein
MTRDSDRTEAISVALNRSLRGSLPNKTWVTRHPEIVEEWPTIRSQFGK